MPVSTPMSRVEFIALIAMLFATIAFSIDSMLPALPRIGAELSPGNLNQAQLILTTFVLGMGIGTFFTGPLSDAFGRKPVVLVGSAVYIFGAALAWAAPTLELMIAARVLQGLGAAAPRVVGIAIVRDLYAGRGMARIMSFAMMVFTLVPAIAPLLGSGIIALAGWRGIFAAFVVFSLISTVWLGLRQPETLPRAARRPLRLGTMLGAVGEMFGHPTVRLSIIAQTFCFSMIFTSITLIQQVFDISFGRAESFPLWFAGIALIAGSASLLNASLVMRLGMRRLVMVGLGSGILLSALMSLLLMGDLLRGDLAFYVFVFWQTSVFFQTGLTLGNLNAIAMEPMGHIAGMAASVIGAVATVLAAALAIPIGLAFDGTPLPLTLGVLGMGIGAFAVMLRMRRAETLVAARGRPAAAPRA